MPLRTYANMRCTSARPFVHTFKRGGQEIEQLRWRYVWQDSEGKQYDAFAADLKLAVNEIVTLRADSKRKPGPNLTLVRVKVVHRGPTNYMI